MQINYISDDGKAFKTKEECEEYEKSKKSKKEIQIIKIFDENTMTLVDRPVAYINDFDSFCEFIDYLCSPEMGLREIISLQKDLYGNEDLNNKWVTYTYSISDNFYIFKIVSISDLLESYNKISEDVNTSISQIARITGE